MKGNYGEECNITACQRPNSATWYNHFNHQYYCADCAHRLNNDEFNKRDSQRLLGHEMCTEEKDRGIKIFEKEEKLFIIKEKPDFIDVKTGRENRRMKRQAQRRKQNRKK